MTSIYNITEKVIMGTTLKTYIYVLNITGYNIVE